MIKYELRYYNCKVREIYLRCISHIPPLRLTRTPHAHDGVGVRPGSYVLEASFFPSDVFSIVSLLRWRSLPYIDVSKEG